MTIGRMFMRGLKCEDLPPKASRRFWQTGLCRLRSRVFRLPSSVLIERGEQPGHVAEVFHGILDEVAAKILGVPQIRLLRIVVACQRGRQ